MVRKTRQDALATRDRILDCAENLFVERGVSHTTLQHIAEQAGVTRGAIYWHFADKAALFDAMLLRVRMPFEAALNKPEPDDTRDGIDRLKDYAALVFHAAENDARARRVFEILTLKVEFVEELSAARQRRADMQVTWIAGGENAIRAAVGERQVPGGIDAGSAALGLWSLLDGLMRAWMMAPHGFDLSVVGNRIVAAYLDTLRPASTTVSVPSASEC